MGLVPADWTLNFNRPDDPRYNPGTIGGRYLNANDTFGITMASLVQGEMLKDLAESDQKYKPYVVLTRGVESFAGSKFACNDDLGGGIDLSPTKSRELCKILDKDDKVLKPKVKSYLTHRNQEYQGNEKNTYPALRKLEVKNKSDYAFDPKKAKLGGTLVQSMCVLCHSSKPGDPLDLLPKHYHFFENKDVTTKRLFKNENFIRTVRYKIEPDSMPPYFDMKAQQKEAIMQYLNKLIYESL